LLGQELKKIARIRIEGTANNVIDQARRQEAEGRRKLEARNEGL
jgi:hypothetical protein